MSFHQIRVNILEIYIDHSAIHENQRRLLCFDRRHRTFGKQTWANFNIFSSQIFPKLLRVFVSNLGRLFIVIHANNFEGQIT